ncbi:MAG TPA: esterase-like activity of phytase family protein [Phenylobacterium sp.]|uniref:esterase-like activity of phytase family protein n=1 Tax=Phenylobacterium sp. TaxID=1871053 RepID=UPI002CC960AC|nr:esterase-like activity of phytase family protein [Phenylobacterium sp.]HXA38075.1 esterase-like activity of phytase family protein [Phenylobacterium sp.]
MRPLAAALAALLLAACGERAAEQPRAPEPANPAIEIKARAVPLNPVDPTQDRVGNFVYAGGLALTSAQTTRLHGLSDLDVLADGRLISVGDEGDLLKARVVLDGAGRLVGATDARLTALTGLDGKSLEGKDNRDSEGQALMPNGDLLVSFERHDRIWLYPADGTPPRPVPSPDAKFPFNEGMEALAPDPARGPDAYFTGAETTGRTWTCTLTTACAEGPTVPLSLGFGLVAARRLPEGRTAWLLRAFNPITRSVIDLRITDADGRVVDRMELRGPLTVDNFEGLGVVPDKTGGGVRFYLISDDNFSKSQRTLLLAFDWKPPAGR